MRIINQPVVFPDPTTNAVGEDFATAAVRITSTDLSLDEISAILGLEPTWTSNRYAGEVRWFFDSDLSDSLQIEEHVARLIDALWERREKLPLVTAKAEVDVWCTVSTTSGFAGFCLDASSTDRAGQMGVAFTISVYAR